MRKSSELAATLSFWLPGLGQLYAESWTRGVAVFAASGLLTNLAWKEASATELWHGHWPESPVQAGLLWGLSLALWLWNVRDAGRTARSRR